jgi:2-haloacid dehalogenase
MAQKLYIERIISVQMHQFVADFSSYRLDEVLWVWQPYSKVVRNSLMRLCKRWKFEHCVQDAIDIKVTVSNFAIFSKV